MSYAIDFTADSLIKKIKHFLVTHMGKVLSEASPHEFYQAFCVALREEIMINWTATLHSIDEGKKPILYYLSMEHLPGKFMSNNITNIGANDLLKAVLQKTHRTEQDLFGCDPDPGLGNGGLGRLASCFADSLATQHYPAFAYGLRYHYGIFEQQIWAGQQIERPDTWLIFENPWEMRKDLYAASIHYRGKVVPAVNSYGDEALQLEDYEEVLAIPYDVPIVGYSEIPDFSVLTLRLWSTKESPKNFALQRYNAGELGEAGENTSLTDVLYPNDNNETGKRIRLKQEFLLVTASCKDLLKHHIRIYGDLEQFADKVRIQINDTHPALIIAELTRRLVTNHDMSLEKAWEVTKNVCNYTNHTVLKESLEEWNEHRMQDLLPRQYRMIQKLNEKLCSSVRKTFPNDERRVERMSIFQNGQISMAHLAIFGSKKVNGVAKLHSEILKNSLFKDFSELFPEKFVNVTNGITQRKWLLQSNPELASFISNRLSATWITDFEQIKRLKEYAQDAVTQKEFLEIKKNNKRGLINFIRQQNPIRDYMGRVKGHYPCFDESSLFDMHIKRFHEYKRQLMNGLHLIMLYNELRKNPDSRKIQRMAIIAGKAAPAYQVAKEIMLLLFCIARKINENPIVSQKLRVVLIENYNVSAAELLIPAADLSEQISTAGMEASGTGNMKLSLNGALTIGTEDGANIEMRQSIGDEHWPFSFGAHAEELDALRRSNSYSPSDMVIRNETIRAAVESLRDGSLIKSKVEHTALCHLYDLLLGAPGVDVPDKYFVIKDLSSYYETQKKVEELFLQKEKWAEFALHNIAGMAPFSSDVVINNYAKLVWNLEKCPIDKIILSKIREEYSETVICRAFEE
jgi:glycogen phosphorylase